MKKIMWRLGALVASVFLMTFVSCALEGQPALAGSFSQTSVLKVTNWNVETFFDSQNDGNEYSEFIKCEDWGQEAYEARLKKLCSVIKALDSDVFVMEELENEGVLFDISNFLAGELSGKKSYAFCCFAKDEGSSIGCGVLSRFPLENLSVHSMDVRTENHMPSMRPIMKVTVLKGGKKLVLLVNHWKSMSGGQQETEMWRERQEGLLSSLVEKTLDEGNPVLACGDFNRDINNFSLTEKNGQVRMRHFVNSSIEEDSGVEMKSPWFRESGGLVEPGSYFFDGNWSRIDNFFISGDCEFLSFRSESEGEWCAEESGIPKGYKIWTGAGYSDHLPISCTVSF